MYKVLILGGYGNFGKRIAEILAMNSNTLLLIAGRNLLKAEYVCHALGQQNTGGIYQATELDIYASDFKQKLIDLSPDLVIHTSGPFQGQDFRVPLACIASDCHYIDLADDRRFVCDITELDSKAKEKGLLIVSGASSVPGLSSTVIDHFADDFTDLDSIYIAIAPGNKAERGEATVRGILSYTGHAYKTMQAGHWVDTYGWMSPRKLDFGRKIGSRWLANVNIPDLELFPKRYPSLKTAQFQAGLEVPFLHLSMVFMAWLAKNKLISNWAPLTKVIMGASNCFRYFGSDNGAMQVTLKGLDAENNWRLVKWTLYAYQGVGPYIPTLSTVIIANKLIKGETVGIGAKPCLGLYTLTDFDVYADGLSLFYKTEITPELRRG